MHILLSRLPRLVTALLRRRRQITVLRKSWSRKIGQRASLRGDRRSATDPPEVLDGPTFPPIEPKRGCKLGEPPSRRREGIRRVVDRIPDRDSTGGESPGSVGDPRRKKLLNRRPIGGLY